jgi:hypothetical protein
MNTDTTRRSILPVGLGLGLGLAGGALGVVAGVLELAIGPDIRSWVGGKQDPTRLGVVTLVLSAIALGAALWLRRTGRPPPSAVLAAAAALLVPGLVCFTTVGRLWYLPGPLLILAGLGVLAWGGHSRGALLDDLRHRWLGILTAFLAVLYILLGVTELGLVGALAIAGGVVILGAVLAGARLAGTARASMIVAGALPFALAGWWSIVAPLAGLLLAGIALAALRQDRRIPRAGAT